MEYAKQNEWQYEGVSLPRGAVVQSTVDAEYLASLGERATARSGLPERPGARVRRAENDALFLQGLCEWVQGHGLNAVFTVTFSDEYARKRGIYSPRRALQDVREGISREVPYGTRSMGFRGKYILAAEWHRTGREVPHVHGLLKTTTQDPQLGLDIINRYMSNTRGRCRFELIRDYDPATLYAFKDVLKEDRSSAQGFFFHLTDRATRGRGRKGSSCGGSQR